jgi:hypothetical protein
MSKTYTRQMNLRRWFPPHDRFAACVARLCILREDFAIEMWGLYANSLRRLDAHSVVWRRLYFWRNLVRTLWEIRKTLETLNTVPEFKKAMKVQSVRTRKKFENMVKKLETNQTLIQRMRDSLGGHVLQRTVEQALNDMPFEQFGYIEVGRTLKETHYKFAGEIVVRMLLGGVSLDLEEIEVKSHFERIASLLPVFALTDTIFSMYTDWRNLLD